MPTSALLILIITIFVAVLLISEKLRPDLLALLVLVILGLSGMVKPSEAFAGFSGSAVMTLLAISIISEGLHQTGFARMLGRQMHRVGGQTEWKLVLIVTLSSAALSLFMNNIATVGVLLPAVMSLSRQTRLAPSRLLMPLAFGTLLGGMATLLTTSNIIVSGALHDAGYPSFGLLDFLPVGAPVVLVGVLYLLWARRWLPERYSAGEATHRAQIELSNLYEIEKNLCHVEVSSGSAMAGLSLQEGQWFQRLGLTVVGLMRNRRIQMAPSRDEIVREGDVILAQGKSDGTILRHYGLKLLHKSPLPSQVTDEAVVLAEVVLTPRTPLTGKSLRELHFREKYGFNVLAVWREGKAVQSGVADLRLRFGDALLVQGPASRLRWLRAERDFIVLEEDPDPVIKPGKFWLALSITLFTLGIAAFGWLPVAVISMAGAVLMILTDCLGMDDAYGSIEWRAIFLIAGMWPLSTAIRSSGLADHAVTILLTTFGQLYPLVLAAILLCVALILTQLMGGQVASLVLAPLALSSANSIGVDPRSLAMAVALGCSLAFITPFGHPVNMMVMSSGGYTLRDFFRVGAPLTVLVMITILVGLHFFWGL
jgi:di/tricarboxylate transporter